MTIFRVSAKSLTARRGATCPSPRLPAEGSRGRRARYCRVWKGHDWGARPP
eukprot:CAMPEP_0116959810 /NCGR_PEP_ID=MMETSP0467-20121206/45557_1 /TAXON_ID=283647 /ORGANISM="Mesodinium pulex, Strain SPMC105" /LENGTH=50 /DNA_ID=CAMNT_0004647359 /DNA_START=58 /DNA_END=210 /DNA_ORIENTATION=-